MRKKLYGASSVMSNSPLQNFKIIYFNIYGTACAINICAGKYEKRSTKTEMMRDVQVCT